MKDKRNNVWGVVSEDGFFQPISSLTAANLEYAIKSKAELLAILNEKERNEQYEECIIIRDELSKR